MTTLVDDGPENTPSDFGGRIENLQYKNGSGNFVLTNVSRSDAGMYECHQGSLIGKLIPNCGLTLVCVDFIKTKVNASQPIIAGGHVTLTCSVTSSPEITGHWHPSLHYSWFKDGTFLYNQTERQVRLGPLTQTDQGNFTCCPSIDVGICLPLEKIEAFPLHLAAAENSNSSGLIIGLTVGALVLVLVAVLVAVYIWRRRRASQRRRPRADQNGTSPDLVISLTDGALGEGGDGITEGTELHLLENGHNRGESNGVH